MNLGDETTAALLAEILARIELRGYMATESETAIMLAEFRERVELEEKLNLPTMEAMG